MKMKPFAMLAALLLPLTALAADGDMHGSMSHDMSGMQGGMQESMDGGMPMQEMSPQMFMKKVEVDGYTVSFHVMPASEGMQHGGSSNFMVKIEKDGAVLAPVAVNSKVIAPDGKAVSQMMMKMGDWYMAGYDLDQPGRYQLMVLFKTADGARHFGGVYYPQEK